MAKNTQQDKNLSAEDQEVENRIEAMMGTPPNSTKPLNSTTSAKQATLPDPTPPPPLPIEDIEPDKPDPSEPEERILVIPSSDESSDLSESKEPVSESYELKPLAGETIEPTEPDPEEAAILGNQIPDPNKASDSLRKVKKDGLFKKWWHNRFARRLTIFLFFALIIAAAVVPNSRYFILNTVGARGSASLTVLDNSTQLPLKNVDVSLAGQKVKTDENGIARIQNIKLGGTELVIEKRAFATINKKIVVGWGSNPLGSFQVTPTGSQYTFYIKDWLTGKTISEATASGASADAQADDKGKILLTIDTTFAQQDSIEVTIKSNGFRDEIVKLNLDNKIGKTVRIVPSRKDVYISNRSGKYDVYSIYIDGKGEKLVLAGTGLERDDLVVVQHPTDNVAALVSSRVNARNSQGYILNTLTLINLSDNTTLAVAQSEQIELVGWIGRRLIYVEIVAGASANDPQRFRLISYDYKTKDKKVLATANNFNDVLLVGDQIYYAPSGSNKKDNEGLIQSNADGSKVEKLLTDEVWNIFRISFDTLQISTQDDWYNYKIGETTPAKLHQSPTNPKNRLYISNRDGKHSLWVDQRDGKGLLIDYDTTKKVDNTLQTLGGLNYPVQWLTNDVIIYRINNDQETADYVLSISGGQPHKITDLYDASGIDRWYYY